MVTNSGLVIQAEPTASQLSRLIVDELGAHGILTPFGNLNGSMHFW
jgi:hypothetical protein